MSDFTRSQKKEILQECFDEGGYCTNCGCEMKFPKYIDPSNNEVGYQHKSYAANVDHIYPKSRGGKAKLWNAQVLCRKCNRDKTDDVTTSDTVNYYSTATVKLVEACLQCSIL
jgi:5-methylcytosine-specific restriction endonuclease McrA